MQVRNVVGNENEELVDPGGHPLPPCIVMERGESLDLWSDRNAPDRAQAFTVRLFILLPAVAPSKYERYLLTAPRNNRVAPRDPLCELIPHVRSHKRVRHRVHL